MKSRYPPLRRNRYDKGFSGMMYFQCLIGIVLALAKPNHRSLIPTLAFAYLFLLTSLNINKAKSPALILYLFGCGR
jgi:hypothetical protein